MIFNIIEGESSPPIFLNLKRDGHPPMFAVGEYKLEIKVTYPDESVELMTEKFNVVKRPRIEQK